MLFMLATLLKIKWLVTEGRFIRHACLILVGFFCFSLPVFAQTIGGACTGAGSSVNGILLNGRFTDLICDGTTYQEKRNWQPGSNGVSSRTVLQVGYDSGACTMAKQGELNYYTSTDTLCYCSGTGWYKLGGTGSSCPSPTASSSNNQYDDYWASTVLLLKASATGTNGNIGTVLDSSSNNFAVAKGGDARLSTFSPFPASGGSILYDGNGDYAIAPGGSNYNFGTGNFTVEFWVYRNGTGQAGDGNRLIQFADGDTGTSINLYEIAGNVGLAMSSNGSTWDVANGTNLTTIGASWNHLALVRNGTNVTLYKNGTSVYNFTTSASLYYNNGSIIIGGQTSGRSFNGYMSTIRISNIARYTSSFTSSTTPFTSDANTILLVKGDVPPNNYGNNNIFVDSSSNDLTLTRTGSVTQGAFSPFSTTGGSGYFNGSGNQYLTSSGTISNPIGTGDFTVQGWFNLSSLSGDRLIIIFDGPTNDFALRATTGGELNWADGVNAGGSDLITSGAGLVANRWYHFAVVNSSGTTKVYVNGVQRATRAISRNFAVDASSAVILGRWHNGSGGDSYPYYGYMSNIEIAKIARYTAAFTPTTSPLTADANTVFLEKFEGAPNNNQFNDASYYNNNIIRSGNVTQGGGSPFSANSSDGSLYFDGSADYLTVPSNALFNIGTGNFTIQGWAKVLSFGSGRQLIGKRYLTTTAAGTWALAVTNLGELSWADHVQSGSDVVTSSSGITPGTWFHFAVTRSGTTLRIFINGVQKAINSSHSLNYTNGYDIILGIWDTSFNLPMLGQISNIEFANIARYTTAFTPPTSPLTPDGNTLLLIKGNNAAIYDATRQNFSETISNNTVVSSVTRFGDSVMRFNGTSDGIRIADNSLLNWGATNFTLEGWIYPTSVVAGWHTIYTKGWYDGSTNKPSIALLLNGAVFQVYASSNNSNWDVIGGLNLGTLSANTWYHFAVVRSGSNWAGYLNGTRSFTATSSAALYSGTWPATIGVDSNNMSYYKGYMYDLRLSYGARYNPANSTITVPTGPFPTQ